MTVDCTGVLSGSECSKQAHAVHSVVCEHLFRQGKLDIGETLVQVIGLIILIPCNWVLEEWDTI